LLGINEHKFINNQQFSFRIFFLNLCLKVISTLRGDKPEWNALNLLKASYAC